VTDPKHCGCGRTHTPSVWPTLEYVGVQPGFPEDEDGPAIPDCEMRNCPCGSTLAVEMTS